MIERRIADFEGKGKTFLIPGVKVKWAKVNEPDRMFEPKWKVDMVLNDKQAVDFKEVGYNVKKDKDGDWILTSSRKERTRAGAEMVPPKVTKDGVPFKDNIGNGSTCDITVKSNYIEVSGKEYLTCYLNEVDVVDLVEFNNVSDMPF